MRAGIVGIGAFAETTRGAEIFAEYPNDEVGFCCAVIVVEPPFNIESVEPFTVAIVGSATVKTHVPVEFDVGGTNKAEFEFVPSVKLMGDKVPTVGAVEVIDRFILTVAEPYPALGA